VRLPARRGPSRLPLVERTVVGHLRVRNPGAWMAIRLRSSGAERWREKSPLPPECREI